MADRRYCVYADPHEGYESYLLSRPDNPKPVRLPNLAYVARAVMFDAAGIRANRAQVDALLSLIEPEIALCTAAECVAVDVEPADIARWRGAPAEQGVLL